jgi:replication factor A1
LNSKKPILTEHLAFLSVKYRIYLSELFAAVVSARKTGNATCEDLKIEYRGSVDDQAIILITKENNVLMQFKAAEELLQRKNIAFESWMNTDKIRRQITRQNTVFCQSNLIQDLRHGMKKVNIEAKVLEVTKPVLVHTQYGSTVMLTNVLVADETGKIKLCLWNQQSTAVTVGDTIQMKNGSVSSFRGERQLTMGRKGILNVLQSCAANPKPVSAKKAENLICA